MRNVFSAILAVVGAIVLASLLVLPGPVDDTDASALQRSGLSLYIDARTGCQYLSTGRGLTPRLNENGKQICEKKGGK